MGYSEEPSKKEIQWRQYNQYIELYKFYLNLVLKVNIFYYGITGAIFSYYFANTNIAPLKYSLLLPVVLSISMGSIFLLGARLVKYTRDDMINLMFELELDTAPDFIALIIFLVVFGILLLIIGALLILFLVCPNILF